MVHKTLKRKSRGPNWGVRLIIGEIRYVHSHTHYFYNHTVGKRHFAVQTEFDLDGLTPTALVPVHAKFYPSELRYNLKFGVFTYYCLIRLAGNDLQSLFALHSHTAHADHIRRRTNNACYSAYEFTTWLFH